MPFRAWGSSLGVVPAGLPARGSTRGGQPGQGGSQLGLMVLIHVPPTGSAPAHLQYWLLAAALPSGFLWLLYWGIPGPSQDCSQGTCTKASKDSAGPAPQAEKLGLEGGARHLLRPPPRLQGQRTWPCPTS